MVQPLFGRCAQGGQRHGRRLGSGKVGTVAGVAQERFGDSRQTGMLAVVQMVRLGRGEQDALDPAAPGRGC